MKPFLVVAATGLSFFATPPADASCSDTLPLVNKPLDAANYILDNADEVGLASINFARNYETEQPEELSVIITFKGASKSKIVLKNPVLGDGTFLASSNAATTFEKQEGDLVFYALNRATDGFVLGACLANLVRSERRNEIFQHIFRLTYIENNDTNR